MRRRNFLVALGTMAAAPLAFERLTTPKYKPIGYTHANDPWALDIEKVTVDGYEIHHVFEFDDVEGWVRAYNLQELRTGVPMIARYKGEVRVTWRKA